MKQTSQKMIGNPTYLSIITLNVDCLNSPKKRHRMVSWIKKTKPDHLLPTRNASH
jgi:hypothetical protein